ncbi:MAG: hypothetical protein ABIH28_03135 [archaeon]
MGLESEARNEEIKVFRNLREGKLLSDWRYKIINEKTEYCPWNCPFRPDYGAPSICDICGIPDKSLIIH